LFISLFLLIAYYIENQLIMTIKGDKIWVKRGQNLGHKGTKFGRKGGRIWVIKGTGFGRKGDKIWDTQKEAK
jgi:hypothetical protein